MIWAPRDRNTHSPALTQRGTEQELPSTAFQKAWYVSLWEEMEAFENGEDEIKKQLNPESVTCL